MKSKIANRNGSRLIMYLMAGMVSGLKILVSAVQSRPCPPFFSTGCPLRNSPWIECVPRFVPTSGTLQRIPAHEWAESITSRRPPPAARLALGFGHGDSGGGTREGSIVSGRVEGVREGVTAAR